MSKRKSTKGLRDRMKRTALENIRGKSDNEVAALLRTAKLPPQAEDWRALKRRVYATYGYRCMKCGHLPPNKKNSNVDHIKPRRYFPELALDFDNLQVLCGLCNKAKGNGDPVDYRPKPCDASDEWSDHNLSQFLRAL